MVVTKILWNELENWSLLLGKNYIGILEMVAG